MDPRGGCSGEEGVWRPGSLVSEWRSQQGCGWRRMGWDAMKAEDGSRFWQPAAAERRWMGFEAHGGFWGGGFPIVFGTDDIRRRVQGGLCFHGGGGLALRIPV